MNFLVRNDIKAQYAHSASLINIVTITITASNKFRTVDQGGDVFESNKK